MLGHFSTYFGKIFAILLLALHAFCVVECTEVFCVEECTEQCSDTNCEENFSHEEKNSSAQKDDCASDDHGCICHFQTIVSTTLTEEIFTEIPKEKFFFSSVEFLLHNSRASVFRPPIA